MNRNILIIVLCFAYIQLMLMLTVFNPYSQPKPREYENVDYYIMLENGEIITACITMPKINKETNK